MRLTHRGERVTHQLDEVLALQPLAVVADVVHYLRLGSAISYEKTFNFEPSVNRVYYAALSFLVTF